MRRSFGLTMAVLALLVTSSVGGAQSSGSQTSDRVIFLPVGRNSVQVDGKEMPIDVPATIISDRTMVPVRFISETMGAQVSWDADDQRVTIRSGGRTVEIWINRTDARVNGAAVTLDVAPRIVSDRTLVPLRFVSENLGLLVGWDNHHRAVYVISGRPANVVLLDHDLFHPERLTVKAGQPVIFVNAESAPHTVTEWNMLFDSGRMNQGWAYTLTLDKPGVYKLFCDYHFGMEAELTVQ